MIQLRGLHNALPKRLARVASGRDKSTEQNTQQKEPHFIPTCFLNKSLIFQNP
jgi:hypothetical protein